MAEHTKSSITREEFYCFMEQTHDIEGTPRLLVPWSNPREHEEPFGYLFGTEAAAVAFLQDFIEQGMFEDDPGQLDNWVLCHRTVAVVAPALASVVLPADGA